jgi:cytochrome c oxidase subunit 1
MMGGTVMAFMGGLHHWWPKMFGKMYNEKTAMLGCAIVFIGFNLTFFTQFFLGTQGMPRRYANYVDEFQTLHQISTVGSWLLLLGFLVHLGTFVASLIAGEKAPPNPWGGLTLEWETDSPPIEHNFHHEPVITHGPYDFDKVVPPHWDPKDYPLPSTHRVTDRERDSHRLTRSNRHANNTRCRHHPSTGTHRRPPHTLAQSPVRSSLAEPR